MWIDTTRELDLFIESLAGAPYVTVDTEFMRVKTYLPVLCLVQVGYEGRGAVIDLLSPNLRPNSLKELLMNREVLKVFHAASQDLEIFTEAIGTVPGPLFDTQIAAAFCGYGDQPGYGQLAQSILGLQLDKSSQNTDWARRPLTERQVEYALGDVTHLCDIYKTLCAKLEEKGREEWIAKDFEALEDPAKYVVKPREAFRKIKLRRAKPQVLAILRELAAWREEVARERDLPRPWVIKDDALVEIALHAPANEKDLSRVRGMNLKGGDMTEVLAAVALGSGLPESEWPVAISKSRMEKADESLVALLQALLKLQCDEHDIATRLVATRADLDALVVGSESTPLVLSGWRREIFGSAAEEMLAGRLGLTGDGAGAVQVSRNESPDA